MSLSLMLLSLSAAILAMQPAQSAPDYEYNTTLITGLSGQFEYKPVLKAKIPSKQCDAGVKYPNEYKCVSPMGPYVPLSLKLEVLDNQGPASIHVATNLEQASVYRVVTGGKDHCDGPALVTISVAC